MTPQNRRADLHPQLELKDAPERRVPTYAHVQGRRGILGNGFMEMSYDLKQPRHEGTIVHNKLTGEDFHLEFSPFEVWLDDRQVTSNEARIEGVEARQAANVSSLTSRMSCEDFLIDLTLLIQRGDHFVNKMLVFHSLKQETRLHRVSVFRQHIPSEYRVILHDGGLYFPVVFVRSEKSSMFFCMDFPGTFATVDGQVFSFEYFPGQVLVPGRVFQTITSHLGIAALTGRTYRHPYHESGGALDVGEQQWFREYLLRGTAAFEQPYVEIKAPSAGIAGPSELEVIEQCGWLDARHALLPRMTVNPDSFPLAETVRKRARANNVGLVLSLESWSTENLRWVALASDGTSADRTHSSGCLACEEYRDSLIERFEGIAERHGFTSVEMQGAPVVECHAAGHDHVPGLESLQKAFQGLVEVTGAVRESCGRVSCAVPYGNYGAGLARLFDSISPVSDEHPLPLPDIHPGRLFADMGRLYFRRSHSFLLPKEMIGNSIGLIPESCRGACYPGAEHYPWYTYHDSAGWRYAVLSAVATGLRHRIQALPQDVPEEDLAFARKWLNWERDHLAELKHVEELFEGPGLGAVDGYGYTTSRGAIVFLFNPTYDPQEVHLRLRLGHDSEYVVRELHPQEMNYRGPEEGLFRRDSEVELVLEPKEVRIIEAVRRSPASAKRKRPEVFGASAVGVNGTVLLRGKVGMRALVGLRHQGEYREEEVRFPGKSLQPHLTDWVCSERIYEDGRSVFPRGGFAGRQWDPGQPCIRNAWLRTQVFMPEDVRPLVKTEPFQLKKPCWAYPDRIFFVVRFETEPFFDPIRTSSRASGIPETLTKPFPMKYGIDLTPLNIGLKAWLNETECEVYPAVAAWDGYAPNTHPVVAYFFEATSRLRFGHHNHVVLYASHFEPATFRGIFMEHLPALMAEKTMDTTWRTVPSESC